MVLRASIGSPPRSPPGFHKPPPPHLAPPHLGACSPSHTQKWTQGVTGRGKALSASGWPWWVFKDGRVQLGGAPSTPTIQSRNCLEIQEVQEPSREQDRTKLSHGTSGQVSDCRSTAKFSFPPTASQKAMCDLAQKGHRRGMIHPSP